MEKKNAHYDRIRRIKGVYFLDGKKISLTPTEKIYVHLSKMDNCKSPQKERNSPKKFRWFLSEKGEIHENVLG